MCAWWRWIWHPSDIRNLQHEWRTLSDFPLRCIQQMCKTYSERWHKLYLKIVFRTCYEHEFVRSKWIYNQFQWLQQRFCIYWIMCVECLMSRCAQRGSIVRQKHEVLESHTHTLAGFQNSNSSSQCWVGFVTHTHTHDTVRRALCRRRGSFQHILCYWINGHWWKHI